MLLLIGALIGAFLFAFALKTMITAIVQGKAPDLGVLLLGCAVFLLWISSFGLFLFL